MKTEMAELHTSMQFKVIHEEGIWQHSYLSVAMRKAPCTERPAPPPMVMPSMRAMWGFCRAPMIPLSMYSILKNLCKQCSLRCATWRR